jgi:hypothetical protein
MPAATTPGGPLVPIDKCYLIIPIKTSPGAGEFKIVMDNLPDITDSKSVSYNDEVVIGRASPIKTYSQSDNRTITMQIHFIVSKPNDVQRNISALRAIESASYPRDSTNGSPYLPPVVCKLKCGRLLGDGELCVVLKQYSVKFPTEVSWDEDDLTPFKFDVDTTWDVVYACEMLPGQERIFSLGQ